MTRKIFWIWNCIFSLAILLTGCESLQPQLFVSSVQTLSGQETESNKEENSVMKMRVTVGDTVFTATLEHNAATDALIEMIKNKPAVIPMRDYAGFEKVGALGTALPSNDSKTTAQPGDIVLYQGNQIVIFYGSNSWSYTRLGKIDNLTGWEKALGNGDVTVTFSLQ